MTNEQKLQWIRDNWKDLKAKGKLEEAVDRVKLTDESLRQWDTQTIIDIEESVMETINKPI